MENKISKEFNFISLLKFAFPTMMMMLFLSIYTMVDGVFVSRVIGTDALSAVNIVYPYMNLVFGIAIMIATGSSAIIANKLGAKKVEEVKSNFSYIVLITICIGLVLMLVSFVFIEQIITSLGATSATYQMSYEYLICLIIFTPMAILQVMFQYYFVLIGKPKVGLFIVLVCGCINILLDYIFIVLLGIGIMGAGLATGLGFTVCAIFGLVYFTCKRKNSIYFVKPKKDFKLLINSCSNGSSEMVINLSSGVTTFLFNIMMLKYLKEDGVASITIILYAQFLLNAIYLGYASGVAPIFSYNLGNQNYKNLKRVFKISISFFLVTSICIFVISQIFSKNIVGIFSPIGTNVYDIAKNGFIIFSFTFLVNCYNIFASSLFTALGNGRISLIIAFLRCFVFISVSLMTLPLVLGVNGIWIAVPLAEVLTLLFSIYFIKTANKKYKYY